MIVILFLLGILVNDIENGVFVWSKYRVRYYLLDWECF